MISAALLSLVLAGPVVLIDNTSSEAGVPKGMAPGIDPLLCVQFEKAFKAAKVEVKCRSDVEAILRLRAMQSAVGSPAACADNPERCAAQTAKMVHCTHVLVATLAPVKKSFKLTLTLVDTVGKHVAGAELEGGKLDGLIAGLPAVAKKISASLPKP